MIVVDLAMVEVVVGAVDGFVCGPGGRATVVDVSRRGPSAAAGPERAPSAPGFDVEDGLVIGTLTLDATGTSEVDTSGRVVVEEPATADDRAVGPGSRSSRLSAANRSSEVAVAVAAAAACPRPREALTATANVATRNDRVVRWWSPTAPVDLAVVPRRVEVLCSLHRICSPGNRIRFGPRKNRPSCRGGCRWVDRPGPSGDRSPTESKPTVPPAIGQ